MRLFNRLLFPVFLFGIILIIGITGFMLIEEYDFLEAAYMTIITVGGVGYEVLRPLSREGMFFTTIIIFINLAFLTYILAILTRYFADGEFKKQYKAFTMENHIEKLHDHVIICGMGRNGQEAAQVMHDNDIPFVILEVNQIANTLPFDLKYFIIGDARNDDILKKAGIERAQALLTTLPNDADNLYVVLTARQENPGLKIISRASQNASVAKLKIAGATNVIMPDKLGGAHMATLVMHPDIHEMISLMTTRNNDAFRVEELQVSENHILGDLNLWQKTGCTVLGIKNNKDYLLNPQPDYNLNAGERIIVMGSQIQIDLVRKLI